VLLVLANVVVVTLELVTVVIDDVVVNRVLVLVDVVVGDGQSKVSVHGTIPLVPAR
jgi:hypothetical protein